ncbi:hypothetical protein RHGRI_009807 [Rhododendron griersonianum]|uniref:non-specific serine/threonine protein kinase n=1 Tax=Rhododendron griersonianum TaxID=479676 RepID=A0AAV6KG51_9ERIC|nr:hypothetical protein RHGRI_009807 [Rhododendron griersonianum]
MVENEFNIVEAAGGIGKGIIEKYAANVTDGTLEIRFYWAGKGTTGFPVKGVYGPLISAISVHNLAYRPPPEHTKGISAGAVVGIVATTAFVIILLLGILWWRGFLTRKDTMDQDLKGLDLQTGSFTLRQIKAATNNFDEANKIGEGGFGSVYIQGILQDALVLKQKGNMMGLVDPKLGSDFNKIEVTGMINVALMCTNVSPTVRPAMSSVVSMLEGRTVPETSSVPDPDAANEQMKLNGMMIELQKILETDTSEGQIHLDPTLLLLRLLVISTPTLLLLRLLVISTPSTGTPKFWKTGILDKCRILTLLVFMFSFSFYNLIDRF